MFRAVFLDRDGTINVEKNYVHRVEDFEFIDGAIEGIALLNQHGFKVVVVSNQSGIARGFYTPNDVHVLHDHIQRELRKHDALIDAFYYCPHHPEAAIDMYRLNCDCRKPNPGMVLRAEKKLDLDLKSSYIVGDLVADIELGLRLGIYAVLVKTGHGEDALKTLQDTNRPPDAVADHLLGAVRHIVRRTSSRSSNI